MVGQLVISRKICVAFFLLGMRPHQVIFQAKTVKQCLRGCFIILVSQMRAFFLLL